MQGCTGGMESSVILGTSHLQGVELAEKRENMMFPLGH